MERSDMGPDHQRSRPAGSGRAIEEIVESGGDGEADHDEGSLQLDSRPMPEWWKWAMLAGLVASAVSFLGGILTLMAI